MLRTLITPLTTAATNRIKSGRAQHQNDRPVRRQRYHQRRSVGLARSAGAGYDSGGESGEERSGYEKGCQEPIGRPTAVQNVVDDKTDGNRKSRRLVESARHGAEKGGRQTIAHRAAAHQQQQGHDDESACPDIVRLADKETHRIIPGHTGDKQRRHGHSGHLSASAGETRHQATRGPEKES